MEKKVAEINKEHTAKMAMKVDEIKGLRSNLEMLKMQTDKQQAELTKKTAEEEKMNVKLK